MGAAACRWGSGPETSNGCLDRGGVVSFGIFLDEGSEIERFWTGLIEGSLELEYFCIKFCNVPAKGNHL